MLVHLNSSPKPREAMGGTRFFPPDPQVETAAQAFAEKEGLIWHPSWKLKVIQMYETTLVRHGVMTVGPPGSGKSSIISTLQVLPPHLARSSPVGQKNPPDPAETFYF